MIKARRCRTLPLLESANLPVRRARITDSKSLRPSLATHGTSRLTLRTPARAPARLMTWRDGCGNAIALKGLRNITDVYANG
jgi:hypothetical protein